MKNIFRSILLTAFLSFLFIALYAGFVFAAGGEGTHHGKDEWIELAWKTFNFLILMGFLYWLLADKIKAFFVDRRKDIKETLENTATQKTEAEKKYRDYAEKIDKASAEIDGLFEMIKAQGVAEKQKIIDDAKKVAQKMKEDAQARIEQELQKASAQLRGEAVQLSVKMAEDILKRNITENDHETMIKEYLSKVVTKN
jgi:F-type H+-transporting ATPase subunit b